MVKRAHQLYLNAELETMPFEELHRWQFRRLLRQLTYAYEKSPYYRRAYNEVGLKPGGIKDFNDFDARVPLISKIQMIEDQRENPPFGTLAAVDPKEFIRIYWAPGPELIFFTARDYDYVVSLAAEAFSMNGVRKGDVVNVTCTYHWVIAGTVIDEAFRRIGCAVIPGGAGQSRMHVDVMKTTKTTVLFAFFTFVEELGKVAGEMGFDPAHDLSLRLAIVTGELGRKTLRNELESTFGCKTREIYGTSEVPFVAAECPEGRGLHVNPSFVVEIIDAQTNRPVPPGESGELVVTDLKKKAQPSIRYRTGDLSEGLTIDPCPCGRSTPRINRILGRVGDIPRVKGLFVVPREVEDIVNRHPEFGRFQLVIDRPQISDTLTVKVELKEPVDEVSIREKLIIELKEKIRLSAEIAFVSEGTIPPDAKVVEDRRRL